MAYVASVTKDTEHSKSLAGGTVRFLFGECNITSYNTTLIEITDITNYFRNVPRVLVFSFSSNGYIVHWNKSAQAFDAFYHVPATLTVGPSIAVEVANGVDVGTIDFWAIGR